MSNHPASFGLTLIREAAGGALSFLFAPVPESSKGFGDYAQTILVVIVAAVIVVLIYKVLSGWAGKSGK
jgi:hypothetical protein